MAFKKDYDPTKRAEITHSPFTIEENGINVNCTVDGKVTLTQVVGDGKEYDEITVPASVIIKTAKHLALTRKVKLVDK